jgi:hypothetical protein
MTSHFKISDCGRRGFLSGVVFFLASGKATARCFWRAIWLLSRSARSTSTSRSDLQNGQRNAGSNCSLQDSHFICGMSALLFTDWNYWDYALRDCKPDDLSLQRSVATHIHRAVALPETKIFIELRAMILKLPV